MAKVTVTFEFDYFEEREELESLMRINRCEFVLHDIDQNIRNRLKHGSDDWLNTPAYEYLEHLRRLIHESGAID